MKKIIPIVFLILTLFLCSCKGGDVSSTSSTTEKDTIIDSNGWGVPVYENVSENEYDLSSLAFDENGRIYSTDEGMYTSTGIDISQFQGDIDWEKVASDGIDFVMLRVGCRGWGPSGLIYEDSNFETNYEGAKAAGLKIGVYFYSQAISVDEAVEEAKFTLKTIKNLDIDYPVCFDWEHITLDGSTELNPEARTYSVTTDELTEFCKQFCDTIVNSNYKAIAYFNCADGYQLFNLDELTDYHFWLAEYDVLNPSFIYDYQIWQYTRSGSVDGIDGNVDIDIAFYDFNS